MNIRRRDADLFIRFPEGGCEHRDVFRFVVPAGKANLTLMYLYKVGALGEKEMVFPVL